MSENKKPARICKRYKCFLLLLILNIVSTQSANSVDLHIDPGEAGSVEELSFLVLNGIIVSEEEFSSVALLQDSRTGENLILKTGESIENFKLVRILDNRIVFQWESETFQMYLGQSGIFGTILKVAIGSLNDMASQMKRDSNQEPEDTVVTKEYDPEKITKKDKNGIPGDWPENFPPFNRISCDPEGRIFVQTYTKVDNNHFVCDVFDPEGRYIAKFALPRDEKILSIQKNYIYILYDKSVVSHHNSNSFNWLE